MERKGTPGRQEGTCDYNGGGRSDLQDDIRGKALRIRQEREKGCAEKRGSFQQ